MNFNEDFVVHDTFENKISKQFNLLNKK